MLNELIIRNCLATISQNSIFHNLIRLLSFEQMAVLTTDRSSFLFIKTFYPAIFSMAGASWQPGELLCSLPVPMKCLAFTKILKPSWPNRLTWFILLQGLIPESSKCQTMVRAKIEFHPHHALNKQTIPQSKATILHDGFLRGIV